MAPSAGDSTPDLDRVSHHCQPPLATATPRELIGTAKSFHQVVEKARESASFDGVAEFNVTGCTDIDPGAVLLLIHATWGISDLGWQPLIKGRGGEAIDALSTHIRHYRTPKNQRQTLAPAELGSYPLRGVTSRDEMVNELTEWVDCVAAATKASDEDLAFWQLHVGEVVTNAFQHGEAGNMQTPVEVLLAGMAKPNGGVQLAVLDRGRGIPAVLRPKLGSEFALASDSVIIQKATEKGVTSQCVRSNQGAGLHTLVDSIRRQKGTLQIMSNNGLLHLRPGGQMSWDFEDKFHAPRLGGTLTIINLRASHGASNG